MPQLGPVRLEVWKVATAESRPLHAAQGHVQTSASQAGPVGKDGAWQRRALREFACPTKITFDSLQARLSRLAPRGTSLVSPRPCPSLSPGRLSETESFVWLFMERAVQEPLSGEVVF